MWSFKALSRIDFRVLPIIFILMVISLSLFLGWSHIRQVTVLFGFTKWSSTVSTKPTATSPTSLKSIAWELRNVSESEGYEVYERQAAGDYIFRSEYVSHDPYRTVIEGKIWKKI